MYSAQAHPRAGASAAAREGARKRAAIERRKGEEDEPTAMFFPKTIKRGEIISLLDLCNDPSERGVSFGTPHRPALTLSHFENDVCYIF